MRIFNMPILISVLFSVLVLLSVILLTPYTRYFRMAPFVCLSAGGLLSVAFLDFLPHSFSHQHSEWTGWVILSGLLIQGIFDLYGVKFLKFLDRFLIDTDRSAPPSSSSPFHHHQHHHHHSHILSPSGVCSIVGCLSICSFFDGIRFFSGLVLEGVSGLITGVSLFFHLTSEALIVALLGVDAGIKRKALFVLIFFMTGTFVLGAGAAQEILIYFHSENLVAFSAGILIYICFVHLLPFSLKKPNQKWFILGLAFFSLLQLTEWISIPH